MLKRNEMERSIDSSVFDDDTVALREFWRFYEPRRAAIASQVLGAAAGRPEWTTADATLRPEEPFHEDLIVLNAQGERYARAGISYAAWFGLLGAFRDCIREEIAREFRDGPRDGVASSVLVARGMYRLLDVATHCIGEAYFATRQQTLVETEARYRAIFEQSPLPMWMFERDTLRFVMVNEAAVRHYGYSRDELLTMTLLDIRRAEDAEALLADIAKNAPGFTPGRIWQHRKKDGTLIPVEIRANDLDLDGRPVRLALVTDVSERVAAEQALRRTEDQLRHAQKMEAVGRLASSVAHDFNNVLMVVQSYASLLEDTIAAEDERREDVAEIRRASERAQGITRQLLTVSRQSVVAPRSIDLDELVAGFVPMLRRLLGEEVALVTHRGGVQKVVADPGQIEQVLMNLAVNARDAMPDGGRLTIESRMVELDTEAAALRLIRPGTYVELAVTDTGVGMDAETQRRIFDPYFTTKEAGKGTGLGLSIAHGIVAQAGGSISVYSEPGRGTTFRVQLPVTGEIGEAPAAGVVVAPRTLPAIRILLVEDRADVRTVAARILTEAGCSVVEAATGEEARRLCVSEEGRLDLAILDLVLPDVRGDLLMRQLRELRPELAFLHMSGYPAGALSSVRDLAGELLVKPFSPTELRAAVARACGLVEAPAPAVTSAPAPAGKTVRRALVVDDDGAFRRALVRVLRKADLEVVDVDSGFKAISALERETFDVVVSDVQMPDGGGLDLLRAVRRVDLDVPVILITGEPSLGAAAEAVAYGAFRYLTKPLDHAAFTKTVEHATRAHALARLRREAFGVSGSHAGVADRAGLEVRFEQAMDGLWMAFQPIVDARTGALFGVEALLRTNEPSLATAPALLDAATLLGRLPLIGRTVRALCGRLFAERTDDLALFVNLHPDDLHDVDLTDETAALSRVASRVVLEVTERASITSSHKLVERVRRLRQLGFRMAVDDIGAGYSGLTSFTELTPEIVKIDMSLVRDIHTSALKQRTVGALCRLCHESGTIVVGEGVETLDERNALVSLGCDLLQGYLIGKPNRIVPP